MRCCRLSLEGAEPERRREPSCTVDQGEHGRATVWGAEEMRLLLSIGGPAWEAGARRRVRSGGRPHLLPRLPPHQRVGGRPAEAAPPQGGDKAGAAVHDVGARPLRKARRRLQEVQEALALAPEAEVVHHLRPAPPAATQRGAVRRGAMAVRRSQHRLGCLSRLHGVDNLLNCGPMPI